MPKYYLVKLPVQHTKGYCKYSLGFGKWNAWGGGVVYVITLGLVVILIRGTECTRKTVLAASKINLIFVSDVA